MYNLVFFGLFAISILLVLSGAARGRRLRIVMGFALAALTAGFFGFMSFWGEYLWFVELDYAPRFWKVLITKAVAGTFGFVLGGFVVWALTLGRRGGHAMPRTVPVLVGGFVGWATMWGNWAVILRYLHGVTTQVEDPILGLNTGFYLFDLPFYDLIHAFLLVTGVIGLFGAVAVTFVKPIKTPEGVELSVEQDAARNPSVPFLPLAIPIAYLLMVAAIGQILNVFHLMYSRFGVVAGPGWTDVHIRLPAYSLVAAVMALAAPLTLSHLGTRPFAWLARRSRLGGGAVIPYTLLGPTAVAVAAWALATIVIPGLFQWLRVVPNEISAEKPYIKHNIEFTRRGFALNDIDTRQFPVSETISRKKLDDNADILSEIRLWDWRALQAVYEQFQEIRLYYSFNDVDVDRYHIDGAYRQVMVSPREMDLSKLARQSKTFINTRFKYTHGYGLTLAPVSGFTREGLPKLFVKDIPPKSSYSSLEVARPELYYGELTDGHVVVNTEEKEFDYPSGKKNVYARYEGDGGVRISNFWRKLLYGWKFDGARLLFSGYPTSDSRIMFHRQILDRIRRLAPFLIFENDPYIVLEDGRMQWIVDAYTASRYYPYSESYDSREVIPTSGGPGTDIYARSATPFHGANYARNSVKVVVDAFDGDVSFYVYEPDDPLINVWSSIFPGMFKPREEMPENLRRHVRYPSMMLLAQAVVYGKYHMTDPEVFYNQEDLWVRGTEKYYGDVRPVEPYYVMWKPAGAGTLQFTNILPFTPKNKQVMIGWIAAMCDEPNYGQLIAYKFPKNKRVLGPQQVETKIDQDPILSRRLSLWDQRGSRVIRGNMLAIPLADTILYVEPIYLQAETAAYPELRLVVVMHNDNLSYAETLDKALEGLLTAPEEDQEAPTKLGGEVVADRVKTLAKDANQAFKDYLRLQGEHRFDEASAKLRQLKRNLKRLSGKFESQ